MAKKESGGQSAEVFLSTRAEPEMVEWMEQLVAMMGKPFTRSSVLYRMVEYFREGGLEDAAERLSKKRVVEDERAAAESDIDTIRRIQEIIQRAADWQSGDSKKPKKGAS